ncbi:MAG: hypothetical protein J5779_01750 [Clostridia bacterium]|nr:hypothetical protein [Clostridia bacterium]
MFEKKYNASELQLVQIVKVVKTTYDYRNEISTSYYFPIKWAIVKKESYDKYLHLSAGITLKKVDGWEKEGDICVSTKKGNYLPYSFDLKKQKYTIEEIVKLENWVNKTFDLKTGQKKDLEK